MTTHWLDEAEKRAETPMLLVERAWVRQRRERLLHRIKGLGEPRPRPGPGPALSAANRASPERQARQLRVELAAWTTRLMQIETELSQRGMT
jgi:hypothetical protein